MIQNNKKNEDFEKIFDLEPVKEEIEPKKDIQIIEDQESGATDEQEVQQDFDVAKQNILTLIDKGYDLLDNATTLAKASDQSRAYEVAADIFQKLVQTQKDLLELHQRKNLVLNKKEKKEEKSNINIEGNAIISGSTTDLLKLLEKNKRGEV